MNATEYELKRQNSKFRQNGNFDFFDFLTACQEIKITKLFSILQL